MNKILLFGTNRCTHCLKLKNLLIKNNIDFHMIDVDTDEGGSQFMKLYEITKVDDLPQLIVGGKILAPTKSFITIDEAFGLVKEILGS